MCTRYGSVMLLAGLVIFAAAACGDEPDSSPDVSQMTAPVQTDAAVSPNYARLERQYETLRASHQVIANIWENLADNQAVRCGNYPDVLLPESITPPDDPTLEPLAALLRRAAINTGEAVALWQAECANPRVNPSPNTISDGLLAVRAAGDALNEAQALLDDGP